MQENLVGYLMDALEADEHEQVDKYLEENPEARQQLETLKRAMEPLEADKDSIDPPPLLVFRSLALIAEHHCQPLTSVPETVPAADAPAEAAPAWWRRADLLVAAALFFAVLGVGIPGLGQLRSYQQRNACADNLRQFHQVFTSYADNHGGDYPGFDLEPPYNTAGMFVPVLQDAGHDFSKLSTCCPGNGAAHFDRYSTTDLSKMTPETFDMVAPTLAGCYAYTLGYKDPITGLRVGPRRSHQGELDNDDIPVMADQPSDLNGQRGNSNNHEGGQNVLHVGGHVQFVKSPVLKSDNIYLNNDGKVAAGVDRFDTVLGTSGDRP